MKKIIQMFLEKTPLFWTRTKRSSIAAKLLIIAQGMKYGLYAWHSQIYMKQPAPACSPVLTAKEQKFSQHCCQ